MFINNSQIDNIQGKNVYLKIYRRLLLCAIFLIYYSSIGYSQINAGTNKTICKGESVTLGSVNICDSCQYLWSPSTGLSSTNTARPVANPTITTTYSVTITSNSYIFTTQITVTVNRIPVANAGADQTICYGKSATLTAKGGNSYSWSNRQVTSIITVSPTVTTQYNVTAYIDNCIATDNVVVYVSSLPKSNFIDANSTNFLKCSSSGGNAIFDLSIKNESTPLSNIKQYKIDWGDSSPDTILNNLDIISHKYTQMGYFNLKCIVIDKYGCTGTFNQKIFNGSNPVIGLGIPGNTTGCLQSAFEFPINYKNISGYTNPPGTIYVISFYYGTDHTDTTYVQPSPPAEPMQSVKHSFNKCSCGAVSLNDKNSFYVKITATNECSPSSFSTAGPIQISQKPICDFDISPLSKGCANMDFTIISKITGGKYIRNNICDSNINKYWVITPANYTIATSINNKLGSSINFPADPNSHGSNSITVRFTKMGKYSIKLVAENACGTDTIYKFKEICIDSIPVAKFNVSDFGGCAPHTVNFTDMSVTNSNCNSVSYNWTISEAQCNNTNAYSFLSETNSSSQNSIIKFNKSGVYNIKLEVSANCGKSISFTSINVKSKPDLILKSVDTICEGLSVSPSVTNVACNTPTVSYSWSFTGGSITGTNNQNPGSITYSKTGNYQINIKGKNECGDTNIRKILNVISKPEVDIGDTIKLCKGNQTQIKMSLPKLTEQQNYTYQWSPSNGLSSSIIAEPIANPTQTTSYSVTITDKIRGCTGVGNVVIKVNSLPVAICDNDKTICSGDSVNLILNVKAGTSTYNYSWYPSNSLNRSDIQSPIAKPLNTITYSCLATDKNGCTTSCDIGINVNSKPSVPSNDVSICSGNNVTLNAAATGNGPFIYSWSPASGLSNPNISNPIVSLTQSTTYIVTVTDKNQCMSTEAVKIDIVSAPVVNFSYKNNNWCTPINVSFISNVFPKGNYIYSWDLSDGQISNLQNPQKVFTNNTNTDKQYTIKLTVNAGMNCNISKEKVITIHPRPEADFDFSTKNTCPPAKINIINNSISSGNTTYSWSVLNNSSVTISNSTVKEPILTFTDNQSDSDSIYYVRFIVFNGDKCSDTLIKSIKIYKRPRANFNIDSALCPGIPLFPKNLSESAIKYLWSIVPSNNVIISDKSGLNPIINFPENLTGNNLKYNISLLVTSDNGCKDSTERKFSSYSKPIISFTKNISEGCSPLEVITCNTSKDPNIRSYYWKHYNGSTDSKLQDTMIFYNNLINDIIFPVKLIAVSNNNCRDSLQQTVKVHSNSKALFSPAKFYNCSPFKIDSTILNLKTFNINSDYNWTIFDSKYKVINQFTGTSFPGYTIKKESDTIYIRLVTTSKYNCLNDTLIKRFTTLKNLKANFSINDSADCNPLKVVITNKSVPDGLFYRWMTNNTVIDTMKNPVLFFRNQSHTSNSQYKLKLLVTSDNAGCIDSIEKTLTVYPTPRADFIGLPVCYGENTLLNNNTIHGTAPISLNIWNYGDNKIDTLQNAIHKYSESGTYNVNLKVTDKNKCSADTTKKVIVYSLPLPDFEVDSIGCMNENIKVNNKSEDVVSCYWDFGNNKTSVQNDPMIVFNKSGCFQIKLISKNEYGCIDSIKNKIKIIVPPEAKFTKNIDSCCAPLDLIIFNKSTGENINYMWNLGNGVINSSMVDSIESIYGQGRNDTIYHIKLNVANICGSSSYIDSVKVKSNPVSILGINIKWSCSPAAVEFSNNLSYGKPDTFIWIWGDSTASYKTNKYTMQFPIKHTYYVNGDKEVIYKPMLIAINNCGSDTISKNITVYPQNVFAFFETDSSSGCQPFTTQFKNYSKGYQNIFWDFGDNTSPSNEISPKHTYNKSGDYVVSLIAKGSCGQDTARSTISVKSLPLIDFKCKDSVCINEIDSFTNVSKSILSFYKWDFGESNIITDNANPTQIFKQAGLRNITLYGISAISNCTGSLTKSILVKPAPVSTIIKSKINGCTPLNIDFRGDTGSHHFWDFNNGNTSNLINPSTIFNENGTYNVKLISMLDNGCSDTSNTTVNVFQSPIADFDEKFDSLCEIPLDVKFINNSVYTDSCHWIFGNGIMSKNKDLINMSFDTAGFYTNTLICYNNFGCTDTIKKTLNVYPAPKAAFDVLNNEGCKQLLVKFINKSKNSLYSYWDFGDNNSSEEMSPVKLYKDSGNYSVRLIATGNLGCSDTIVKKNSIVVYPKPHAEFVYEPINDPVDNSGKIKFNNLSKYSLIYLWDLGDGTTETSFEPLHRYYMYGTYNVILYAENSFNCRDTVSQEIKVDNFKGLFIANAFSPDHGSPDVRKFKPRGVGLKSYHIWIYDTWGNVIWESDKLDNTRPAEGWDGTINGNPVMQSVFVWKVEATFEDGSAWLGKKYENGKYLKYGSVTLIR